MGTDRMKEGWREGTQGRIGGWRKRNIYWWPPTLMLQAPSMHPTPSYPPSLTTRRLSYCIDVQRMVLGMVEHSRTWPDIFQGCRQREVGKTAVGHETSLVENLVCRPVVQFCVCVCVCVCLCLSV